VTTAQTACYLQKQHLQNLQTTSVTEVRSASARWFAGMWRPLVNVITTLLLCCDYISSSSVVWHVFSVLCVYSKFRHHPHPLGNFVPKFVSFAASIAELAHGENSRTHITQSFTHPAYLMLREPKRNYNKHEQIWDNHQTNRKQQCNKDRL